MPFDYITVPQIPASNLPPPIPNTAVTYKVDAVSNTINVSGSLAYNTNTTNYDVVYPYDLSFPTINVGGTTARVNTGAFAELRANSNAEVLYVSGAGVLLTTNTTSQKTLTITTTADLRVSQNSALTATNNWTIRISANDTQTWAGIAWSPELGLFAAVTSISPGSVNPGVRAATSPDGINWTGRSTPANNVYRRLIWAPELGLFVAVGTSGTLDRVMTSPDGITWTSRTTANNFFLDVAWSKELNLLVAVASTQTAGNNHIMSSPDGVIWTSQTNASNTTLSGVTWSKELGIFVAIGTSGDADGGGQCVTSPDGINWTIQTTPTNNQWQKLAWSPELGLFAAVSANGATDRVMTSPDGINWTTRTTSASLITWTDIIWVPQYEAFVAVGNSSSPAGALDRIMISFDGITWTNQYCPVAGVWQVVTWSPELGILVAGASNTNPGLTGNRIMTSQKVGMWRTIDTAASNTAAIGAYYSRDSNWVLRTPAANVHWEQVIWADRLNLFVAISSNTTSVAGNLRVMTSPDGVIWTSRATPNDTPYVATAYNGNVIVALSSFLQANQVMISTDAITWQRGVAAANVQWRGVTWNGNIFCAVAMTGTANGVMISTDGTTWSTRVPAADNAWRNVIWVKELGLFVAVGASGTGNRVMTSPDGTTWTPRASAADNSWISLAWNGKLIVAVAFTGTNNRVMTSPDGINWTSRYTPVDNQWTYILWTGTQFIVVANTGTGDRLMTSPDGINWTVKASPGSEAGWKGLAWNSQVLVAVATSAWANGRTCATWTEDNILMAGTGVTLTANSQANTITISSPVAQLALTRSNNLSAFIYTDVAANGMYTSWANLYADYQAAGSPPASIGFLQVNPAPSTYLFIPSGTYVFARGTTWDGLAFGGEYFAYVKANTGAVVTGVLSYNNLHIASDSTGPIHTLDVVDQVAHLVATEVVTAAGKEPWFKATNSGTDNRITLTKSTVLRANAINVADNTYLALYLYDGAFVDANAVVGLSSTTTLELYRAVDPAVSLQGPGGLFAGEIIPGQIYDQYGPTASRPPHAANGAYYFDTTLGLPVWRDASVWQDPTSNRPTFQQVMSRISLGF